MDPPARRRRAPRQPGAARGHAPDAAGTRPGGVGRRGHAGRRAAAARRALFDRRRTRDARRAAAPGGDLQLQPLHAARLARGLRLHLHRPRHRARHARSDARRAQARSRSERPDRHLGRRLGRRGGSPAPAVQAEGRLDLWQVAIKPGKPLAFGEVRRAGGGQAWFVGLPGNPVSSFVTFLLAVRPLLLRLQGAAPRPRCRRRSSCAPTSTGRARTGGASSCACGATPTARSSSSPTRARPCLTSAVWGDGVVDIAPGQAIRRGDGVRYLSFADLLSPDERHRALLRLAARDPGPERDRRAGRRDATSARCATC